ncbi:hypothetical protein BCEN4_1050042 [Burkholderia cenocepacia]|nr:hypothetical protein BCEN4_1050042 [Burkholderia cenocepacia]
MFGVAIVDDDRVEEPRGGGRRHAAAASSERRAPDAGRRAVPASRAARDDVDRSRGRGRPGGPGADRRACPDRDDRNHLDLFDAVADVRHFPALRQPRREHRRKRTRNDRDDADRRSPRYRAAAGVEYRGSRRPEIRDDSAFAAPAVDPSGASVAGRPSRHPRGRRARELSAARHGRAPAHRRQVLGQLRRCAERLDAEQVDRSGEKPRRARARGHDPLGSRLSAVVAGRQPDQPPQSQRDRTDDGRRRGMAAGRRDVDAVPRAAGAVPVVEKDGRLVHRPCWTMHTSCPKWFYPGLRSTPGNAANPSFDPSLCIPPRVNPYPALHCKQRLCRH